jgi:hypothetical protein
MKFVRSLIALVLTGILPGAPAILSADVIESFSHTTVDQAIPFTDTFTLPKFDTSLGTLTGVTLTLAIHGTAEVDVTNPSQSVAMPFSDATATLPVTGTGPDGSFIPLSLSAGPLSGTAPPGATTGFPGTATDMSNSISIAPANFSFYEGLGSLSASFSTAADNGTFSGSAASGVSFTGSATVGGQLTVTYSFTAATPEPSSIVLAGLGVVGLACAVRSRRKV